MGRLVAGCHEDVTRKGESQPCEKPAVAMRLDPEEREPYPVCAYHARADMVPLSDVLAGERERIAREIEGEVSQCRLLAASDGNTPAMTSRFSALADAYDGAARIARGQA